MAAKKELKALDLSTEAKIKAAARNVFHKKGFAATRTRDIAEEAGLNLALLNYYFRSKQKLFDQIMFETMSGFLKSMSSIFNDERSTLEEKITLIVEKYIDLLVLEPEIPLFIMSEIRGNVDGFLEKLPIGGMIFQSVFMRQYALAAKSGIVEEPNPLHFLMNLIGMVIFPFMASPMLKKIGNLSEEQFNQMMHQRKKMIPVWIKTMMMTR